MEGRLPQAAGEILAERQNNESFPLADVQWYSYLASFFLVLLFAGITDLLLSPKILRIDMAESLKANEWLFQSCSICFLLYRAF